MVYACSTHNSNVCYDSDSNKINSARSTIHRAYVPTTLVVQVEHRLCVCVCVCRCAECRHVCVGVPSVHTCVCRCAECTRVYVGVLSVHTCVYRCAECAHVCV